MEKEVWKIIEEFPNYKVSNLGRIKNIRKDKLMTILIRKNGYCVVKLSNNGNSKECKVHRDWEDFYYYETPVMSYDNK